MKKVALVFVLAVILPSLVLAWLAVRSLRDQQFLVERQQSLLCQHATDTLAQTIADYLAQRQREFGDVVEDLASNRNAAVAARRFDTEIHRRWPLADVGFCVTLSGEIACPVSSGGPEAQRFLIDNSGFLANREAVEVYPNANVGQYASSRVGNNLQVNSSYDQSQQPQVQKLVVAPGGSAPQSEQVDKIAEQKQTVASAQVARSFPNASSYNLAGAQNNANVGYNNGGINYKSAQARKISPQVAPLQPPLPVAASQVDNSKEVLDAVQNLSKAVPAEAEFAQLIGSENDGMFARFLQNKLKLMFWHRLARESDLVFGAQLDLKQVVNCLRPLVYPDPAVQDQICVALLDDNAKPVAISRPNFQANWKRPFVATEVGDALPHWEVAAYLVDPAALNRAACIAEITLGLLVAVLVLAIVVGSWLIVRSLTAELTVARQKTDFVSNVSHELKTPLTSIRMFSELLAEGRVTDTAKQRSYLQIITAEAARLTRLINNVLDFSRMERGEKKYNFAPCDLVEVVRSAAETFRPHLEANGFRFECEFPPGAVMVRGDADALSQVVVNLLSNAEKYSNGGKEVRLRLALKPSPLPHAEVKVLDRGAGVPRGSEEKVFEKFYRAHDSLSSGIQGSGLGLTIARQIARAHGGDVVYEGRDGGGSCFVLRIPVFESE